MKTAYLTIELSLYFAGMVHRYICIGNLSPEFTASILNTKGSYSTGIKVACYLLIRRREEVIIFAVNFYSTLDRSGYGGI